MAAWKCVGNETLEGIPSVLDLNVRRPQTSIRLF